MTKPKNQAMALIGGKSPPFLAYNSTTSIIPSTFQAGRGATKADPTFCGVEYQSTKWQSLDMCDDNKLLC